MDSNSKNRKYHEEKNIPNSMPIPQEKSEIIGTKQLRY